jgi:hypothetical protein
VNYRRRFTRPRAALIVPLGFSDNQIKMLARAVRPIAYRDREAFVDSLSRALAPYHQIGDAELSGILARLQHLFRG